MCIDDTSQNVLARLLLFMSLFCVVHNSCVLKPAALTATDAVLSLKCKRNCVFQRRVWLSILSVRDELQNFSILVTI